MERLKTQSSDQERLIKQKQADVKAVSQRLESIEEKFFKNDIDSATYQKWHPRALSELATLNAELSDLKRPLEESWKFYNENLTKLADLHYIFNAADIHHKHAFIGAVFNNSLFYEEGIYRTPYLLPIFHSKRLILKEKKLLEVEQLVAKNEELMECSGIGS